MTIPIDLAHRPYNSVRTNVLHCDAAWHERNILVNMNVKLY